MNLKLIFEIKKFLFYLCLLIQLALLYFNLSVWHSGFWGWVLFICYLLFVGSRWQRILKNIFGLKENDLITRLFAFFAVFLLLSFGSSIFSVWYKITPFIIFIVYLACAAFSLILDLIAGKRNYHLPESLRILQFKQGFSKDFFIKNYFFLIPVFIILWCAGLFLLWQQTGDGVFNSPWQIIDKLYLPVFSLLTFVLGIIVFSQHKVKVVLLCIILHSVLLHLYLPMSHSMPWGGDVWRHIAIEQKLMNGEYYPPVLAGPEAKWREVLNIDLPEALIIPNKYFYGQLWGSTVLLAQTLQIDLLAVNKWLLPVLWSVLLPLMFFRMGKILFGSWRSALLVAVLPSAFFPLQVLGSISLPVSLGYLSFFFVLMLWLQYLRDETPWQRRIATLFAVFMVFGYSVHLLFIWFIFAITYVYKKISLLNFFKDKLIYILGFAGILFFPLFEIAAKTSAVPARFEFIGQIKQLVGQFSGWYFASAIRPHDILSGNIVFNHTPNLAFVSSFFSDWRWPVIPVMIVIWVLVGYALFFDKKSNKQAMWAVLKIFTVSVFGGYVIGWFVLQGDRSFIRRFDAVFAFCLLIFLLYGLSAILKRRIFCRYSRIIVLLLCLSFAWLTGLVYASGPDMRVVSKGEYDVALYVWQKTGSNTANNCVLADTWVLLALEGLSGRKIVGGGFPIDYQFAQNERVSFLNEMQSGGGADTLLGMHESTNSGKCFIILPENSVDSEKIKFIDGLTGDKGISMESFLIWEEKPTSTVPVTKNS